MSSIPFNTGPMGRAEKRFREAFERLKRGKPIHVPKGSKVNQYNVAKEAGVDPSALRPKRYSALIAEIRQWKTANVDTDGTKSQRQIALAGRRRNRGVREQLAAARSERDDAMSKLVDIEAAFLDVITENERLRAQQPDNNVTLLRPGQTGGPGGTKA